MSNTALTSIILILQQAALISIAIAVGILWKEKRLNFFTLMMSACAIWAFGYSQELASQSLDWMLIWVKVQYVGIALLPVFWLFFVIEYTQHTTWLKPRNIVLMIIVPLFVLASVWTYELHGLFYTDINLVHAGSIEVLSLEYGAIFWLHTVYSYLQLVFGTMLLIGYIAYYPKQYRLRIMVLLLATIAPWVSSILYLTETIPVIDTTPIAFTIVGILLIWSITRLSALNLPVAYHTAIESLSDGVILIDAEKNITEVNPAMEKLLMDSSNNLVGHTVDDVFKQKLPLTGENTSINIIFSIQEAIRRHLKLQISAIKNRDQVSGHVIIVHDISQLKIAEDNARFMLEQVERIKKEWEITADSLDQLICLINEDGIVLRSNLAVENWGLESITRVKGRKLTTLVGNVYSDLAKAIDDNWSEALETLKAGISYDIDVEDTHLGHFFEVRIEPLLANTDKRLEVSSFAVVSIFDVTKRKHLEMDLESARQRLEAEHEKSEALLLNILPQPIAERLKDGEKVIADSIDDVTVLFADIVGFTKLASRISATELVQRLNDIFSTFDDLATKHGLEKIKTLGDAYMVVGGLPLAKEDHAQAMAHMALDMQVAMQAFSEKHGESLSLRIGIHTGSVVAGVIGTNKIAYDLWGDTVNIASRMESHGIEDAIQVSEATYQVIKSDFELELRGTISIKNKGDMQTYLLKNRLSDTVQDEKETVSSEPYTN